MEINLTPLATLSQIKETPSRRDGIPADLEDDLRAYGAKMIQQAGILLKQKQVAMATAQVLFQRFWYTSSMEKYGIAEIGMGALYLASKLEECPLRMRDVINVYDLLIQQAKHLKSHDISTFHYEPMSYFSQTFYDMKDALIVAEMQLLKRLGFYVDVSLPYGTLVNYLRVLNLLDDGKACQMAWGYLNDALQTPVYAIYPIPVIVCASIFLVIRHLQLPLPSERESELRWWELFDASYDDVWLVCGLIMRLYRPRSQADQLRPSQLLTKKDVRRWLHDHK
ncbi:hypothetical protein PIIN_02805 [Serendipita indica DSM 11827]|uniref:Cyclin N-terminal domain-containing protein n=1 Tax=Serendipita indica (strain DSM 11827) TaxID=1109443 RepID=G4TCB0_SERID|nr:hypothetical protein PIIN_02805 [Serendipita indica DSM 11827]